ncbi:MAG: hypothetical protein R3234_10050 [Thermoanaerobaculia bacterium]|nr:hypothetical protein [Thermoanaerobaculia bacterium]
MSRLPRHLEHLKTGFTAEAVSAAMFRAFAEEAEQAGKPNLAGFWETLADRKDRLAIAQLRAGGRIKGEEQNLKGTIAEEQYENEVLYPRLIADLENLGQEEESNLMKRVVEEQERHAEALDRLRREMTGTTEDVSPQEVPAADL